MKARSIFETVLYAKDLKAAEAFYRTVFGLEVLGRGAVAVVFQCGAGVLLVFDPEATRRPGRGVPSHGAEGQGHVAFAMPDEELDAWRAHLNANGVPIEMEVSWPEGGRSLYVRDPAGNSVELAPPTLWGGGWRF
jgi:catechol 2,3-dioxygenase-like lactoylglutathione lyase family enzyme